MEPLHFIFASPPYIQEALSAPLSKKKNINLPYFSKTLAIYCLTISVYTAARSPCTANQGAMACIHTPHTGRHTPWPPSLFIRKLSDPYLTPLPQQPGLNKYIASSLGCEFAFVPTQLLSPSSDAENSWGLI